MAIEDALGPLTVATNWDLTTVRRMGSEIEIAQAILAISLFQPVHVGLLFKHLNHGKEDIRELAAEVLENLARNDHLSPEHAITLLKVGLFRDGKTASCALRGASAMATQENALLSILAQELVASRALTPQMPTYHVDLIALAGTLLRRLPVTDSNAQILLTAVCDIFLKTDNYVLLKRSSLWLLRFLVPNDPSLMVRNSFEIPQALDVSGISELNRLRLLLTHPIFQRELDSIDPLRRNRLMAQLFWREKIRHSSTMKMVRTTIVYDGEYDPLKCETQQNFMQALLWGRNVNPDANDDVMESALIYALGMMEPVVAQKLLRQADVPRIDQRLIEIPVSVRFELIKNLLKAQPVPCAEAITLPKQH